METKAKIVICPRCKVNELNPRLPGNALSRRDNKSYICPECGTDEALIDFFGGKDDLSWLGETEDEK